MSIEQQVILVNEQDEQQGTAAKMHAHEQGLLHRAFSIFIFSSGGEILLQRRALSKYHSGGLWTNACCSHPYPGESIDNALQRRLDEEMGFGTTLRKIFDFVYKADVENGLVEHEFDHVYAGIYDGPIVYNKEEVMDCRYVPMNALKSSIDQHPEQYTTWFRLIFDRVNQWHQENFK